MNKYDFENDSNEMKITREYENICPGFKQCDINKFDVNSSICQECLQISERND